MDRMRMVRAKKNNLDEMQKLVDQPKQIGCSKGGVMSKKVTEPEIPSYVSNGRVVEVVTHYDNGETNSWIQMKTKGSIVHYFPEFHAVIIRTGSGREVALGPVDEIREP